MSDHFDLGVLMQLLRSALIVFTLAHLVGAVGLGVAAAKLGHRHGWLAWIPVLNIVLAWRMAAIHFGYLLLCLIPLVNLAVFAWMGARIAKRLGQPTPLGALFGLPLLGNLAMLAIGVRGRSVSPSPAASDKSWPSVLKQALIALAALSLLPVTFWVASWMTASSDLPSAEVVATELPARRSGTLTLFPVDTDSTAPALPSNVVTAEFGAVETPESAEGLLEARRLPDWLPPDAVATVADSAVAAEYVSESGGDAVHVVTMALRPGASLQQPSSAGRKVQRAEVTSPQGEVFSGYRVDEGDQHYFALQDEGLNRAIVISTQGEEGADLAERLVQNVGNGHGLLEEQDYRATFSRMPPVPSGASGGRTLTFTSADIQQRLAQLQQQGGNSAEAARMRPLLQTAARVAPDSASVTLYPSGEEASYFAGVASFGSAASVWAAVQAIRTLGALVPEAQLSASTTPIQGSDALLLSSAIGASEGFELNAVVMPRDATLAVLGAGGVPQQQVLQWAQSYAAANQDELGEVVDEREDSVSGGRTSEDAPAGRADENRRASNGPSQTSNGAAQQTANDSGEFAHNAPEEFTDESREAADESVEPRGPETPPKGHRPELDAKDCVIIAQVSQGDSAVSGGGKVLANQCGETVEVFWCAIGPECDNERGNMWTLGAGRSWPISAKNDYHYGACRGRNSGGFTRGTAGAEYACTGP
jgi:hypothetical protein